LVRCQLLRSFRALAFKVNLIMVVFEVRYRLFLVRMCACVEYRVDIDVGEFVGFLMDRTNGRLVCFDPVLLL
jgi:hypothetical protein